MRYATATAFRTALEARLNRTAAINPRTPLPYLRRAVVFERLMARLLVVAPNSWILKGAVALDFRFGSNARNTKDLDIARTSDSHDVECDLLAASILDLGDYFNFRVAQAAPISDEGEEVAARYSISARLDGRRFEIVTMW
jgi:hypothetical protein